MATSSCAFTEADYKLRFKTFRIILREKWLQIILEMPKGSSKPTKAMKTQTPRTVAAMLNVQSSPAN